MDIKCLLGQLFGLHTGGHPWGEKSKNEMHEDVPMPPSTHEGEDAQKEQRHLTPEHNEKRVICLVVLCVCPANQHVWYSGQAF